MLKVLNEALDGEGPLLATIFARSLPFADAIKSRPDLTLVEVRADNRERVVSDLSDRIREQSKTDETTRRGSSACRVEEPAHRLFLREFVVELHRLDGGQHVRWDFTFFQEIQRLARNVKAFLHSP